ncbi:MAG TPA: nucleoside-diphosphate kinase [Candidatus Cloacimonadota bacterium]|nr:nucleoside-diphosphate kinase [Candidatus Cloacimonadota bacterium]
MEHETLLLIKPDATARNLVGEILQMAEKNGFIIDHIKTLFMTDDLAAEFYQEHAGKEFYHRLINYMKSGKIVAVVLHRNNAVEKLRELVGDTDFQKARLGTIRKLYAETITRNSVHASDSIEHAAREIGLIFPEIKQAKKINSEKL